MATTEEQLRILQERVYAIERERAEMREATIYKFENVPEPTCSGEWWRRSPQYANPSIVTVYKNGDRMEWLMPYMIPARVCREEGVTWTGPIPVPEEKSIPAQPPPLSERLHGKHRASDEAIADEIRAAAMMLLDGVLHAEEWLAAARRVRAKIERKEENKCVSNEELGRIVLTVLRGVHHTLDAEYYEDRTYREVGRLLRARLEV